MAKPYNSTCVTEVLVAITSRLFRIGTYPFTEEEFDEWQSNILRLVERMSIQLDREDVWQNADPDMADYEELMNQFQRLLDEGIYKYPPASTWMTNNR